MLIFKDSSKGPRQQSVTLLNDAKESVDKGVTLAVYPPASSISATQSITSKRLEHLPRWWEEIDCELDGPSDVSVRQTSSRVPVLKSTLHTEGTHSYFSSLLSRRIVVGEAKWLFPSKAPPFKYVGEFAPLPKYWEWLEDVLSHNKDVLVKARVYNAVYASLFTYDRSVTVIQAFCELWCPMTNTLHTSVGELSISLWDLYTIGGLPACGSLYDEVVPSAHQPQFLSVSCKHLFSAFHKLSLKHGGSHRVTSTAWIDFWFRGLSRYNKLPKRTIKRIMPGKPYLHPSGDIDANHKRTKEEEIPFSTLNIKGGAKEETYLAAFLSCWLCEFVLPGKDVNVIRPGVFRIAAIMARGNIFNLVVPVLANIYKGLGELVSSSNPCKSSTIFSAYYLYGWLAVYFDTHIGQPSHFKAKPLMVRFSGEGVSKYFEEVDAQKLFRSINHLEMRRIAPSEEKEKVLIDNGKLSDGYSEYFISQRSCYLTSRCSNAYIVQPYSPHRFGRQFGFHQDIPGDLKEDFRTGSLAQVVYFGRYCIKLNTGSELLMPLRSTQHSSLCTRKYVEWWSRAFDGLFMIDVGCPVKDVNCSAETSKLKLKRLRENSTVFNGMDNIMQEPVIQKGVIEILDEVSASGETEDQQTPVYQPSQTPSVTRGRGKGIADSGDLDHSQNNSDCFWKRKKKIGEASSVKPSTEAFPSAPEKSYEECLASPHSNSHGNFVSIRSPGWIVDSANSEYLRALYCLTNDPKVVSAVQKLVENDNFDVPLMQVEDENQIEDGEYQVFGGPSRSEFSIQGPTEFDLITKQIFDSHKTFDIAQSSQGRAFRSPADVIDHGKTVAQRKPVACPMNASTMSVFNADDIISKANHQYVKMLGDGIIRRLVKAPFDGIAQLREEAEKILTVITDRGIVDTSPLATRVRKFIDDAEHYMSINSTFSLHMTPKDQAQKRTDVESQLASAKYLENTETQTCEFLKEDLTKLLSRELELKKEQECLLMKKNELEASISRTKAKQSERHITVLQLEEDLLKINATSTLNTSAMETLDKMRQLLENARQELADLDWLS